MPNKQTKPETNFEHWLSQVLSTDPHYMHDIMCNYYDTCDACPAKGKCNFNGDFSDHMQWLQSPLT